jgi:hypothetical protein
LNFHKAVQMIQCQPTPSISSPANHAALHPFSVGLGFATSCPRYSHSDQFTL